MTAQSFLDWLADMKSAGLARSDAENVIPAWKAINDDIHALLAKAMDGRSAEERIAIITEGYERAAA